MNACSATMTTRTSQRSRAGGTLAAGLLALLFIPLSAGVLRLVQVAGGPDLMPADDRFAGVPTVLVIHIVSSACFALLGIGQFMTRSRRRHLTWHRRTGRVLIVVGLAVVWSALWLTLRYPTHPGTGPILFVSRLVVSVVEGSFLLLGVAAIRRGDVTSHRAWMVRAYALALGAGTQVFTEGLTEAAGGVGIVSGDLAKLAGWVINLAAAEVVLRWSAGNPGHTRACGAVR